MSLFITFLTVALLILTILILRRNSKNNRLDKLRREYRIALNGSNLEEAVAIGRAYCYLLKGFTGPDDEKQIRDDWEAIQQNKPSVTKAYTNKTHTCLTGETL